MAWRRYLALIEASCACVPAELLFRCLRRRVLPPFPDAWFLEPGSWSLPLDAARQADRAISTGQLRGLPRFHLRPIDVVVYHGSQRDLVLRRVSLLDAFSGDPGRT